MESAQTNNPMTNCYVRPSSSLVWYIMKNSMSCGIRNGEVASARGATTCFVKKVYMFIVDVVIKFGFLVAL